MKPVSDIYDTPLFPYIEGDVLAERDGDLVLTIKGVFEVEMQGSRGTETKVLLSFEETGKGLILNKTNAQTIWTLYGRKTAGWRGQRIALHTERVSVAGRTYNAIRVKPRKPQARTPTQAAPEIATETPPAAPDAAPEAEQVDANSFWREFHDLKRAGKLPQPDLLRDAPEIAQAKTSGDWTTALSWLRGKMRV